MERKDAIDALRKGKRQGRKEWPDSVEKATKSKSEESQLQSASLAQLRPALALSEYEKEIFDGIAMHLEHNHMLAVVDSITLTMLARNMFMYHLANDNLKNFEDYLQVHTNGAISPSAAANLSKQAEDQILKLSSKLGLSPADRAKIIGSLPPPPPAKTESDDLLD